MPDPLKSYGRQYIDDEDIRAVTAALRGDFLTSGPAVEQFEDSIKTIAHARHAISCSSGTAGLHIACHALNLGPGQCAIVPSLTFLATANAVVMTGAEVVFCDVDPHTGIMRPDHLEDALSRCTFPPRAVLPVHLCGQTADMAGIASIARAKGMGIIEDACHAFGTAYEDGGRVGDGRHSDMTMFSFHPVKAITTGEGGAVTTNDDGLATQLRRLRSHGMVRTREDFKQADMAFDPGGQPNPWYYEMPDYGYNYRLTDIQAALGTSQIEKLPRFIETRARLKTAYDRNLAPLAPHVMSLPNIPGCKPAWHIYPVSIDFEQASISRGAVMRALNEAGIGCQVHYIPVHSQPYYRAKNPGLSLPGAQAYYARTLTLPLHVHMEENDVEYAVQTLARILGL